MENKNKRTMRSIIILVLFTCISGVYSSCKVLHRNHGFTYDCVKIISNETVNLHMKFKLCQDPIKIIMNIDVNKKAIHKKITCNSSSNFHIDIGGLFFLNFKFLTQLDGRVKFKISPISNLDPRKPILEDETLLPVCNILIFWFLSQPIGIQVSIGLAVLFGFMFPLWCYCYSSSRRRQQGSFPIVQISGDVFRKTSSFSNRTNRKRDEIPMV